MPWDTAAPILSQAVAFSIQHKEPHDHRNGGASKGKIFRKENCLCIIPYYTIS